MKKYLSLGLFISLSLILTSCQLIPGQEKASPNKNQIKSEEKTPTPTPSPETKTDQQQIQEFFVKKYNKSKNDTQVVISHKTNTHAQGGVSFANETGGAIWLAHQENNNWLVDFDGHGAIPCSSVQPYDYPKDMVPECWDEQENKLVKF